MIVRRTLGNKLAAATAVLLFTFMSFGCVGDRAAETPSAVKNSNNPELFTVPQEQMSHVQVLTVQPTTLARTLRLTERFNLQLRADAFNAFNHPNFANPQALTEFGPFFMTSQSMSNRSLGGLNPLFQQGGPRSLQLSLKLTF